MTNNSILKILFIEDLPSDVDLAVLELRKEQLKFEYTTVCTRKELIKAIKNYLPDLVISDYIMPTYNGLQALRDVQAYDPSIPFIVLTGSVNEETAVECIKAGAVDYIIKEHITRLPFAVKEALEQVLITREKKAAYLLLKESEEKIQSIFRAAPVGIGLVVDRTFIEVNDTFCKMTGYSRKELIENSAEMIYASKEEYIKVGIEKYRQIEKAGTGRVESKFKTRSGKLINVIMGSTPLDKHDLSKGVTFTVLDITERIKTEESLRLSEEKFRSIADNLSDVIFITDADGIVTYISASSVTFGYAPDECIGRSFGELLATGEIEKAMPFLLNALNTTDINSSVSLLFKRKDGSTFYGELKSSVFKVGMEKKGVLGLIRDITDKMNREIELRKLSRAVEQSPASIVITDTAGLIEYANPKLCEITGYSLEELIGKNPSILSSKEKSREEYKILWDTITSGNEWKGEFHNKKKNGELYWESALVSPIKNDKDEITHYLGIKEDITLRKKLEAATMFSEQRYRELFLNNPVPTYIFDEATLEFVEVNDASVVNYGYSREEFAKMTLKDIRSQEDIPKLLESISLLGMNVFHSTSMRHRRKNGQTFPVEITSHSLPEKNGRKTRLVIALDITERVTAAEQMKIAMEKAETSDKLKTTFLNNISHEVRTPLNGILGFAQLITKPDLSEEEQKESISMLFESSDRLLNTITNYMDISLLTSGSMSVNNKVFIPAQILRKLFINYKPLCLNRGLELFLDIPFESENYSVYSDPEIFRKIISHFLDNSVKFTERGSITFGYAAKEDDIEFFVRDSGIGIGKESIDSIFERFAKEDKGPFRITEGSGLGLSIAKGMSEIIGGKIRVESELGKGSCFCITLQLFGKPEVSFNGTPYKPKKYVSVNDPIMIVEDDETNFFYLKALISRSSDVKILHASTGREAIDLFKANQEIKLILMDIKMPEIDGLEATRQIKLINNDIPIIAITAYAMSGDEERVLAAGCDGYISKPVTKDILLKKIAEFVTL